MMTVKWVSVSTAAILLFPLLMLLVPSTASATIDASVLGTAPGRYNSIRVADVDGDGNMEVVFGNYDGNIVMLEYKDGGYRLEWKSDKLEYRLWGIDVGDVNMDGKPEIVAGGGDGHVFVIDAKSKRLLWTSQQIVRDAQGIRVGDINGDGRNEIVVGCGYRTDVPHGRVYVFDGTSHVEMFNGSDITKEFDAKIRGMAIADIDHDGEMEVIAGSGVTLGEKPGEGYIRIFDGKTGALEWTSPDTNGDVEAITVADADGDGNLDIVGGNGYRYHPGYAFQYTYKKGGGVGNPPDYTSVWTSEDIGPKVYGLAVGDIDGDGVKEIVTGNQPGYIWAFDGVTKQVKWKSELLGADLLGIALADVDGDGTVEMIAAQGGYQGKADFTSAYSTPHIYVLDGKTKAVEFKLGEQDYTELGLQVGVLLLVILLLVEVNVWARMRKKKGGEGKGEA